MSTSNKDINSPPDGGQTKPSEADVAVPRSEGLSVAGSTKTAKRVSSSSERQIKFEKAQRCLENAALVSKRIKEHRKATAELLGRPFDEDDGGDTASEMASTMSERTSYSAATDSSAPMSVQDALNIPGISESLANTLKQKELLMERIKQYKEISRRPIVKSSPLSRRESVSEAKESVTKISENTNLVSMQSKLKEKETALSIMQAKMRAMETTLVDLQEKLSEKDQIIDAKTKATSLMSDSLSKKEKDSLALLEDTKQQMSAMQENFVAMETEWKAEKQKLVQEIKEKDKRIISLEEANTILENERFEISVVQSKLAEELNEKNKEIEELNQKLHNLNMPTDTIADKPLIEDCEHQEKGSLEIAKMDELTKKVELLEQLNCQIRQTNKELENKLISLSTENKPQSSPSKKSSPLPTRKGGRNTASRMKSPWRALTTESSSMESDKNQPKTDTAKMEMVIQSLNKDILDKEFLLSEREGKIVELQTSITEKQNLIDELTKEKTMSESVNVSTETDHINAEACVSSSNNDQLDSPQLTSADASSDLEARLFAAQHQIAALNEELENSNKNMVKVKSNHKLKLKQLQKTIDNFSKVSDSNAEMIKLNEEIHQLTQKVAELEEEKGNLQLHLVDYDSGRLTEMDTYKKMIEMETLAESRLNAISELETQKFDLVQELHDLRQKNIEMEDKLADMVQLQNEQVCTEIKSVQLEEQLDNLTASIKEMELVTENLKLDKEQLNGTIKHLQEDNDELNHKLQNYMQENIELTDKLEKLSAEKVSSAESIEIVESLTTQEKIELEQYNKGMIDNKMVEEYKDNSSCDRNEINKLVQESAELSSKIELFTQERQEVMEKLSKLNTENESLQQQINDLNGESEKLEKNIEMLTNEKSELLTLNEELCHQIEELKRERIDVMKESFESSKPIVIEEATESGSQDVQQEEKSSGDKGPNRTKTVKQLTKEILKLKNTIKDREAEIADCQMKILSLEEQQQKTSEYLQINISLENKLKLITEENNNLKEDLNKAKIHNEFDNEVIQLKDTNLFLQQELQRIQAEYSSTVTARDSRIQELENILVDYEKQVYNYNNSLQQKDKEVVDYLNQITKLNEVSQKLKSTIDLLEDEKTKDQTAEQVKSLNKQISVYQKKCVEFEERIRFMEEEKAQLLLVKNNLESKCKSLEVELKSLQDSFTDNQILIKNLQAQQFKNEEESKERDEEIHEIKLQLRKESIENEKLRTALEDNNKSNEMHDQEIEKLKQELQTIALEKEDLKVQFVTMETKNKDLLEKLKKFAGNLKKKTLMYTDLEKQLHETQSQLDLKNKDIEQLSLRIESLPAIEEKLRYAEEELGRLHNEKAQQAQTNSEEFNKLVMENEHLKVQLSSVQTEINKLNEAISSSQNQLISAEEQKNNLIADIDSLNKRIVELEIEQKNSTNFVTKINTLENEITQKEQQIIDLLDKLENQNNNMNQIQYGHEAKLQERDLYLENLEAEMQKYKNRITRLEKSISFMEDSRHSLERKADQLGDQLQEKQKAYYEYTNQEDELVSRIAMLMDHDRVVEKQLHEIESENKEIKYRISNVNEENERLRKALVEVQDQCNTLSGKAIRTQIAEEAVVNLEIKVKELENQLKSVSIDHQNILKKQKHDIEELEVEFNNQIENSIKEKKSLSEKYEKINEHVIQLQQKIQEYRTNIQNLNSNLEELTRINEDLRQNAHKEKNAPDYTEQYVTEINNLNAIINSRNTEITTLCDKINTLNLSLETFKAQSQGMSSEVKRLITENASLNEQINRLQNDLYQKDEQVREMMEKKRLSFEMNIPKTEGMIISSTIEALNVEPLPRGLDMGSLESQIMTSEEPKSSKHKSENLILTQEQPVHDSTIESLIVPKKSYLCYKGEETKDPEKDDLEIDPFNSDEGWGLGDEEPNSNITMADFTNFNIQIKNLKEENEKYKSDLASSNTKLLKALKKLKELKSSNEMLSNELKISKQIPETSFLDSAIEDELKSHIAELDKKIDELTADLNKEKRDKEAIKKQNEVFNNANDRLTELKEKMDNEIELWKFKFKAANDKLGTIQWGESQTPEHKVTKSASEINNKDEVQKLEQENEELQVLIEQLTTQNKELTVAQQSLKSELCNLTNKLESEESSAGNVENLLKQLSALQQEHNELRVTKKQADENIITTKNQLKDLMTKNENIEKHYQEQLDTQFENLRRAEAHSKSLEEQIHVLTVRVNDSEIQMAEMSKELERTKSDILSYGSQKAPTTSEISKLFMSGERQSTLNDELEQLKTHLNQVNVQNSQLESEKIDNLDKLTKYDSEITELKTKLDHLNTENDQLLSTVTELRSSISSAMDQRGFEIAELWKQHLAQREADFQKTEQELRSQLTASENKYEQLLDNVQSSSQEETNKLVNTEQLNALQSKLHDKEEHLITLQNKYAEVVSQLDLLRSEIEDEKVMLENRMMAQQDEYEKQIKELAQKNNDILEQAEIKVKETTIELEKTKEENINLNREIEDINTIRSELEVNIINLTKQLRFKDSEVEQKLQEYCIALEHRNEELEIARKYILECEKKVEDLNYEKEAELAVLRLKIHENNDYYEKIQSNNEIEKIKLTEELNDKIVQITNLNRQITDLNTFLEEHKTKAAEMQAALENQEMEIVTLKDELENMQQMMKNASSKLEKHVTFATDTKPGADEQSKEGGINEMLEMVPRAELDLALYMLHQRDVRCEELTMELTRLLEERDTLQLRLSDSLRSCEELKMRYKSPGVETEAGSSHERSVEVSSTDTAPPGQPFVDTHRAVSSRSSSMSDPDGDKPKLQAKLSELRTVRHSRDVVLRQESEQRQLDMRLMQRDVVNLPPEAVEQLQQAHHTLSRDSQSTSTVLLNWLRGKSTPKVVHNM